MPHSNRRRVVSFAVVFVALFFSAALADPLPRATPEREGISSAAILDFIDAADSQIDSLHSFMLVRHGHVVAEGWWGPYDAGTPHVFYSLSKSFTSTAVGLAIADGKLSLDDEVLKFFPEDAPADPSANLKAMRVRDLLRMSSGNQSEAPLWHGDAAKSDEPLTKKFLAHPVPFKPGTHFMYNSPATYMLSAIVQKVEGRSVLEFLKPRLFGPIGFADPTWIASPQGVSSGAWGLFGRTEEIANFGQLYLQKGEWGGKQIVPATWVEQATALQTSNGGNPKSDWDQGYGYQFWRCRHGGFRGDGAFGQYCVVLPEQDAVIAITGGVRDMQAPLNLVWDKLLPAMKKEALPADDAADAKLKAKLAGLILHLPAGKPASPLAEKISGRRYDFPENERGVQSITFDMKATPPTFTVRTAAGESRTVIGIGSWAKSDAGFANGIEKFLGVPALPLVAASGAWAADDVLSVKLALYQTPYNSTLVFHFDGDKLLFDSEHNAAFGPTKQSQLIGTAAAK